MKNCFMGIDIGTSNIKAVIFNEDGFQIGMYSVECSMDSSINGQAEIDPDDVLEAIFRSVKMCVLKNNIDKNNLAGIGLSSNMHSLLAVNQNGEPLTKLILWADTRAKKEADFISKQFDVTELYKRTGCRIQHPMYPLSKILWLKNHERQIFEQTYKFITIKEYLIFKLFGEFKVDCTLASSQGYYNIWNQKWDTEILKEILDIDESKLSEVVECTHVLKDMDNKYAEIMGINRDIPVIIGSGDGILANVGCGIFGTGAISSTIGTSGALRISVNKPLLSPNQQTWCYSFTKEMWVAGGAMNNGGLVLKWIRDNFDNAASDNKTNAYQRFDKIASEIPPGSDGLIFLPYLTGERSPDWNADVRGIMYGLSYFHGKGHILRASMEGVMYRLYSIYEVISSFNLDIQRIIANGGYIKSDLWLQIQADIFNKEILISGVTETSALGAAYMCMVALKSVKLMGEILPGMKTIKQFTPNANKHDIYQKSYALSQKVYSDIYYGNKASF